MITFKEVKENDFPQLHIWRNNIHVKEYWDPDEHLTFEATCLKYSDKLNKGKENMYIIVIDDLEIGFLQAYFLEDTSPFKIKGVAKGIDLYIGELDFLHKGFGKDILTEFMKNYVFSDDSVDFTVIDPAERNKVAIKAYQKAGFTHVNTAYNEHEKEITYYMAISRDKFFCNL